MGLRTRGRSNRILVNLDVSAPATERFCFMGFINFIAELLKDPRTAIASWIAAGPLVAYGCVFLIIFIETGVSPWRFAAVCFGLLCPQRRL